MKNVSCFLMLLLALCCGWSAKAGEYPCEWLSLGVTEDPSSIQRVVWRTSVDWPVAVAQIAPQTGSPDLVSRARCGTVLSREYDDYGIRKIYHEATFDGLKPATEYLYRIGDGGKCWSEWFRFRTAEAGEARFSMIYMADVQEGTLDQYPRVVERASAICPEAALWLFTGDLTNDARDDQYTAFFRAHGRVLAERAVAAVPDNHEYHRNEAGRRDSLVTTWGHLFGRPCNRTPVGLRALGNDCFDYQGCRFILLNSRQLEDRDSVYTASVLRWTEECLRENPNRWTIVAMHQPFYPIAEGRSSSLMRRLFQPLFERWSVDLVLSGHDHVYSRITTPDGRKRTTPVYITSNAGSQTYAPAYHSYTDRIGSDLQLFQVLDIGPERLLFSAYDAGGRLYDRIRIEAKRGGKRLFVEPVAVEEAIELPSGRRRKYTDEQWLDLEQRRDGYWNLKNQQLKKCEK